MRAGGLVVYPDGTYPGGPSGDRSDSCFYERYTNISQGIRFISFLLRKKKMGYTYLTLREPAVEKTRLSNSGLFLERVRCNNGSA